MYNLPKGEILNGCRAFGLFAKHRDDDLRWKEGRATVAAFHGPRSRPPEELGGAAPSPRRLQEVTVDMEISCF